MAKKKKKKVGRKPAHYVNPEKFSDLSSTDRGLIKKMKKSKKAKKIGLAKGDRVYYPSRAEEGQGLKRMAKRMKKGEKMDFPKGTTQAKARALHDKEHKRLKKKKARAKKKK